MPERFVEIDVNENYMVGNRGNIKGRAGGDGNQRRGVNRGQGTESQCAGVQDRVAGVGIRAPEFDRALVHEGFGGAGNHDAARVADVEGAAAADHTV